MSEAHRPFFCQGNEGKNNVAQQLVEKQDGISYNFIEKYRCCPDYGTGGLVE